MQLKLFYVDGGQHPVLGQVFHQCQEFSDGKEVVRYQRYLANTLSFIARSVDDCNRVLSEVEMIESGGVGQCELEGDGVDILISQAGIQVDIKVNDDWVGQLEGQFSLSEFKSVVVAWKNFLQMPESLNSEVTIELQRVSERKNE